MKPYNIFTLLVLPFFLLGKPQFKDAQLTAMTPTISPVIILHQFCWGQIFINPEEDGYLGLIFRLIGHG